MAQHHFPNVTLSLTLPISCHICLGKVRQPVICVNHHVFCSTCIDMWLKTASRCPACRVPITEDNPCREIIGGTNESEPSESYAVKRRLRKTRGELLLKEYEDDIEALLKENEELKAANQRLEAQLRTALDPCTLSASQREEKSADLGILEEWTNKLRAATDRYCEGKQEMERLKEANKTLRCQNMDLVQESVRLKEEVASRSPQKFGRYTVAALKAKIQQYERDMDRLQRALERTDQYIEDLESRVAGGDGGSDNNNVNERPSDDRGRPESEEAGPSGGGDGTGKRRIAAMRRSLSDMETASIRTDLEGVELQTTPRDGGGGSLLLATSLGLAGSDAAGPASDPFLPSTPASAFRSLSLKSPCRRGNGTPGASPPTYLRRLTFQDCGGVGGGASTASLGAGPSPQNTPVFWGAWQGAESGVGPVEAGPAPTSREGGADDGRTSSEASMDAAYLDKISELDSMMLEGEGSGGGSRFSPPSSLRSASDSSHGEPEVTERQPLPPSERAEEEGCAMTPSTPVRGSAYSSVSHASPGPALEGGAVQPPQTDEPSSNLPFDPAPENNDSPSGTHPPAGHASSSSTSSSSSSGMPGNTARDKATVTPSGPRMTPSQPPKRKSHSPFNITSPSKLSKYI